MITYVPYQDIFSIPADYYVNTNNTEGISGAGLAYIFKKKFPAETKEYERLCAGKHPVYPKPVGGDVYRFGKVLYCFTKESTWEDSKVEWIFKIVKNLDTMLPVLAAGKPITVVSALGIGAGLGGLDIDDPVQAWAGSTLSKEKMVNLILIKP